jgi:glycogen synthase
VTTTYDARMPRLTIAFVTTDYPPDAVASGIGSYTRAAAEGLAERGHKVHVVSRRSGDDGREPEAAMHDGPVVVHRLGPPRLHIPLRLDCGSLLTMLANGIVSERAFRRRLAAFVDDLVEREGVQLVEAADSAAEMVLYRPWRHAGVPFVVRLHGPTALLERFDRNIAAYARSGIGWLERRQMIRATHLTCPSATGAALVRTEMRLGRRDIVPYPNPPASPGLAADPGARPAVDPNLIVFVGRVTRSKGVELLVRAFVELHERRPETRLAVVGPDCPTGNGFASTRSYLEHLLPPAHRPAVTFTGYLPPTGVADAFQRAAVCVFPSLFEVFGYTCLEAMTLGKAIVASDRGGMADLLDHGRCGLLFTPPDEAALTEHLRTLLDDPDLARDLGAQARDRATTVYGREPVLDQIEDFYRRAVGEARGGLGTGPRSAQGIGPTGA